MVLCPLLASAASDDTPVWLRELTHTTVPQYGPKVNTVVLLTEENKQIGDNGRITTTSRAAIKILARQGVDVAFSEQYDTNGGKVRDFHAWMIAPSGKSKKYSKEEILDVACATNDVYNECRRKLVSGKADAEPGAVFGYEATVEEQSYAQQLYFHFQEMSPVLLARFTVTVPSGWEIKSTSFNAAPPEAAPSGGVYTWQMENLPAIERETASPSFLSIAPWVGVNLLGGANNRAALSWPQVAKLLVELNEGQYEPNEAMTAKARSLVEGATTELEKIRAIGRFTQQVNYVSIQVDVAKGGGYRPHAASQVFQKLYGDCKDKANLTRAMLKAVGITAYPVAIYSGDRTHVTAEWPSLGDFNHAISAIRVGPETKAPAVIDDPHMGRIMLFDPTNPYVQAGYLPDHEQASLALIGIPGTGNLIRVPAAPVVAGARERRVEAVLKPDGSISGSFTEKAIGEAASEEVTAYRANSQSDYTKAIERWVGRSIQGATASGIQVTDHDGEFVLKGQFASPRFAQAPQPTMMIFKAALLGHGEALRLTEKTRKYPVVVNTDALLETVQILLPEGFKVDELPPAVQIDSPFGKYTAKWESQVGAVVFSRSLELQAQSVPADQYGDLKRFLDKVYGSANLPVVLMK
jgi:Domain of Unknown Function with PDB structure (DUF3857)/Transglutaminase-like superfamily